MAQHDQVLADQAGAAFRADLNNALAALFSNNSEATEPSVTTPYMWWADTTSGWLKQRNAADNAWLNKMPLADAMSTLGSSLFSAASASAARSALVVLSSAENQTQAAIRFTAGGTGDAITGTLSPAIGSYTAGLRVTTTPSANTVTDPTLNLNSLGVKTIKKRDSSGSKVALVAGDYNASGPFDFEYDGTDFVLLNPLVKAMTATVGGLVPTPPNNTTTFLRGDGAFAAPSAQGITLGTPVASTSGTAIDFTSLPAGLKRITVSFDGVSTNGTSVILIQIGDSGGVETTGYKGTSYISGTGVVTSYTAGLAISFSNPVQTLNGAIVLTLLDSSTNTWAGYSGMGETAGPNMIISASSKSLSATLDRIRITTLSGSETFDAGKINIAYE